MILAGWAGTTTVVDWWRHRHLITLDAVNAEVYPVLQKMASRSGVPILAATNTSGRVTVHFYRTPVEDALNVIADQTDGRWQKLYLMARTSDGMAQVTQEVIDHGPPVLVTQMAGMGGGMMMGGGGGAPESKEQTAITLKISGKPFKQAVLEFALNARMPIAVEPALDQRVDVEIKNRDLASAVQDLAQAGRAKARMVYHFRAMNFRNAMAGGEGRPSGRSRERPSPEGAPAGSQGQRENWQERMESRRKMMDEQIALLPPEERQKLEKQREEWQQMAAEMAQATPEERRARMEQMAGDPRIRDRFEQRLASRIKNLTPEQRVERYQRFAARQARQQQRQQQQQQQQPSGAGR